jgi:hypothetical protein
MSILEQARLASASRRRQINVGPQEDNQPTAEPKIIDIGTLTQTAEDVFRDLASTDFPEGANVSKPKVWSTPIKTVMTHIDKSTWMRMCAASVEQYLKEVSNRERYGRWGLYKWEILVEERVHNRWIPIGHDNSTLANLAPGTSAIAAGRNMRYREQLGYCVIAMQAIDTVGADKTVWKGGFVSSEQSIGTEIADALRKNNSTNKAMEEALNEEREKTSAAAERLAAQSTEIHDLKLLVAQTLAALKANAEAQVLAPAPVEAPVEAAPVEAAPVEAAPVEAAPKPAPKKRRTRRRRATVKDALKNSEDDS